MTSPRTPVRYGLFGLGGALELGMGVLLAVLNAGRPLMVIGIVLAIVGIGIFVIRVRGARRAGERGD